MKTVLPFKRSELRWTIGLIGVALVALFHNSAEAQMIEKVKAPSVLINLQGQNLPIGSEWLATNEAGRKTALIKIKVVRGGQAVGFIEKGIAAVGENLLPKPMPKSRFKSEADPDKTKTDEDTEKDEPAIVRKAKGKWGAWAGYALDSMSFTATGPSGSSYSESASLTGNSYQLFAFYDWVWAKNWSVRLHGGYDTFNGAYNASNSVINSGGGATSTIAISAIAGGGDVQWFIVTTPSVQVWIGGGFTYDYVMNATINLVSLGTPSSMYHYGPAGGVDFDLSKKYFLPLALHYDIYSAGSGITQTAIRGTGGIGLYF